MGAPAFLFPETWAHPAVFPAIDPATLDRLRAETRLFLDGVRRDRPGDDTALETTALTRVSLFGAASVRVLGAAFVGVVRAGVNEALTDIVRKELLAAEPERKLALRHIEHAVHRYAVLIESLGATLGVLPSSSIDALLDELTAQAEGGGLSVGPEDRVVLRFQLDVLVALDVLDAALDELTFWAFRAITGARRVEALPAPTMLSAFRGELARARARRAWLGWDEAEIAKELAPWPSPSR
jgi:hypothetical protein